MVVIPNERAQAPWGACAGYTPPGRRRERNYSGQREAAIEDRLADLLPRWFRVARQVRGQHPTEGRVRIDFCCYPNEELLGRGFEDVVFGVEVKHAPSDQMTAMNVARQAHLYTEATFAVHRDRPFGLAFVCVCPSFVRMVEGYPPCLPDHIARVMAKLKVAELVLYEDAGADAFSIYFSHAHRYFDSVDGRPGTNPRLRAPGVSR